MKTLTLLLSLTVGLHATPSLSQLISTDTLDRPADSHANRQQAPIMSIPKIALPENDESSEPAGDVMLSDVIGKERVINIFAGFTRDIDSIAKRLDQESQNTTVLAPLNSEIQKLPRKPWEDPKDYSVLGESAYDGPGGEDRAHRNLRRFVEAHIVPISPWKEGQKVRSVVGSQVWWERQGDKRVVSRTYPYIPAEVLSLKVQQVQPGNIEVSSIASSVANGQVWVLKGVMNYE
ncbi:hypothetical protein MMC09_004954 [Bachmanniomyces sp. S44760]|nr:hypothetical protein [Bachmanniomyces sp. S44760]